MTKYNLQFLEEKLGVFHKEYQFPTKPISGFNLIYIETQTKNELDDTIKKIKEEMSPGYIWGYVKNTKSTYVTRAFGENKIFSYNPKVFKNQTEYVKGKQKVLNNLTEDTINDLFDQKAVFDYFYRKLWDLRIDLGKEIRNHNDLSDNVSLMAAQHIIDRIIFTYFICEKNLVTLNGENPLNGKTLFSNIIGRLDNTWEILKILFFEQFSKKESKDLELGKNVYITTPYLNGGLFRPKIINGISEIDLKINYSKKEWQKIFEPLNKYTWIIEDEIPDHEGEYEGNLTPEIMGHIYEKFVITLEKFDDIDLDTIEISDKGDLIKGNKEIGAYYTPEYITDYILRSNLNSSLNEKIGLSPKKDFEEFIHDLSPSELKKTLLYLDEMTICDPACGSGAFLIKAGEILLEFKINILKRLKITEIDRYHLKKDIIIKNLYGVDIQEGAVEICKLRLWLWLISSLKDDDVEPLPNIEYNYVVGNSLVGWVDENLEQNVLININESALWTLDTLKLGYKSEQKTKIDEAIKLLKTNDMRKYALAFSLLKSLYSYSSGETAEILKITIERIRSIIYEKVNMVFYYYVNKKGFKYSIDTFLEMKPFHWKVEFKDVLDNGGFQLIVGNPPYIRNTKLPEFDKNYYASKYYSTYKQYDIYVLFFEISCRILQNQGFLGFITSNKFLASEYGKKVRDLFLNYFIINYFIDVSYIRVFKEASTYPVITILKKESKDGIRNSNEIIFNKIEKLDDLKSVNNNICVKQSNFFGENNLFIEERGSDKFKIIKKMDEKAFLVGKIFKCQRGSPKNKIKIVDTESGNSMHFISPKSIDKYFFCPSQNYFVQSELQKKILTKEKILLPRTVLSLKAAYDSGGKFIMDRIYHLTLKDSQKIPLKYVTAILNSTLMDYYYKIIFSSTHVAGGYLDLRGTQIKKLPIKVTTKEKEDHVINLVNKRMKVTNEMMALKNNFIRYLKDNSIKISKKLNNYQDLSFDDFVNELKKNKTCKKDPELFNEKYLENISELRVFIEKISLIDAEIDELVYLIYGINEKEIKIIKKIVNGR